MKYIFIFLTIFSLLNCKIEDNEEITIVVNKRGYYNVGSEEGKFGLETNTIDQNDFFNVADIEKNAKFNFNITNKENTNTYPLNCRLWKENTKGISIFCDLQKQIINDESFIIKNNININYNSKNVTIMFNIENLALHIIGGKLPFLYSSSQEKQITDNNQKIINLEFYIDSYNRENLFIYKDGTLAHLDNCKKESNKLKCELPKKNLDIIANKKNSYDLFFIAEDLGFYNLPFVKPINIIYPEYKKQDIKFSIVKLMNNEIEIGSFVTFETSIKDMDIDKIKTISFNLNVKENSEFDCHFIKHDKSTPLYISCRYTYSSFTIKEIEGFNQSDSHYKYNFILDTQKFTETIYGIEPHKTGINFAYPETLDFTNKDSLDLLIYTDLDNITLNEDGEELKCEKGIHFKKCNVPKSHFKNKENGYYLFHHKINGENNVTNYEFFGVNAILTGNSGNSCKINKYSFGLFILCFLIL